MKRLSIYVTLCLCTLAYVAVGHDSHVIKKDNAKVELSVSIDDSITITSNKDLSFKTYLEVPESRIVICSSEKSFITEVSIGNQRVLDGYFSKERGPPRALPKS